MPRLTEQEQQEIIRYLEADKPLPDKFRFLLFEDKREVELVWNGKTSEVCNIVLPFQVIEQVDEPRAEKPVGRKIYRESFPGPPLAQARFGSGGSSRAPFAWSRSGFDTVTTGGYTSDSQRRYEHARQSAEMG